MMASTPTIHAQSLWNRGFISLLFTQFFEAASDNIIKGVILFAVATGAPWESVLGQGGNGIIGIIFTSIIGTAWRLGRAVKAFQKFFAYQRLAI